MSFEANVRGCYVCWSETLAAAYQKRFQSELHTIVKIGRSTDVFDRVRNHRGQNTEHSTGRWAVDPDGYGHVSDWRLWRLTTDLDGHSLSNRERILQRRHSRVPDFVWRDIHHEISDRVFRPLVEELYLARIAQIESDFPLLIERISL